MEATPPSIIRISPRGPRPRSNFQDPPSRKRTESNFLRSFEKAYFARAQSGGLAAEEFALAGFGIADLVWIGWSRPSTSGDFTAVSWEKRLARRQVFAFEGKIKDWRRALQQAFRYRYFADKAIVVMPEASSDAAIAHLEVFRHAGVGLWTFDGRSGTIRERFTPARVKAFNPKARLKAIRMLTSRLNLRHFSKELDSSLD